MGAKLDVVRGHSVEGRAEGPAAVGSIPERKFLFLREGQR
jgi:hypothetical protein